jgi:uncharacterized membrane protein
MYTENPRSTVSIGGLPLHAMLVPFPIVCFFGTFATDIAYWQTANVIWETFSVWLLAAGLVMGGFALLAGLIDFLGSRQIREMSSSWQHAIGNIFALILSLVNVFIHSRDGYTAVVPLGLVLSATVVIILLVTGWMGRDMVYRQRVGVMN